MANPFKAIAKKVVAFVRPPGASKLFEAALGRAKSTPDTKLHQIPNPDVFATGWQSRLRGRTKTFQNRKELREFQRAHPDAISNEQIRRYRTKLDAGFTRFEAQHGTVGGRGGRGGKVQTESWRNIASGKDRQYAYKIEQQIGQIELEWIDGHITNQQRKERIGMLEHLQHLFETRKVPGERGYEKWAHDYGDTVDWLQEHVDSKPITTALWSGQS